MLVIILDKIQSTTNEIEKDSMDANEEDGYWL